MAPARSPFIVRWLMVAVVLCFASVCSAQFPLPIPTRPTSFPLERPQNVDGRVVAWVSRVAGSDNYFPPVDVPGGLSGVVQVAAGRQHALALKSDGTVESWGGGRSVPDGLSGVVQVVAGDAYSLALKSDGTVVGWGFPGNLTVGHDKQRPPEGLSGVVQVAAGRNYWLALKGDGTVYVGSPRPSLIPDSLSGVVQVAAGYDHYLALKSDGTVEAWLQPNSTESYDNDYGQARVPYGLSGVVQVAAGGFYSLALKSDGTVVAWGKSDYGQARVPHGLTGVVQVAAGGYGSLALKSDGTVVAWVNDSGAEISGTDTSGASRPAGLSLVTQVAVSPELNHLGHLVLQDRDSDGDRLGDGAEVNTHNTDPSQFDTDRDWLGDGDEIIMGTDPRRPDTDDDRLNDGVEVSEYNTDPTKADTDSDGLRDGEEIQEYWTDPLNPDTDGDGFNDGFEVVNLKSDPLGPNHTPSFVRVGDPKNPDEDNAGFDLENAGIGYVGEDYFISTTEVTCLMYARFLNAVAKTDFLYGLYNTFMGPDGGGGIVREGSSGDYTYEVRPGFENRPVNFVSFYDALRYINWLHNGQPATGLQDSSTTENGAYKLLGANPRNVIRNAGAVFFLPDQDEWHKAAFFDPNPGQGRPADSYWPFADQSTTGPGGNFGDSPINVVATSGGASHYGTYDQGGNVWEWTETVLDDGKRLISAGSRPMAPAVTTRETADLGFRVCNAERSEPGAPLIMPALVRIGEEFNLGDDTNERRGAVPYEFNLGTYEVSNAEYAAFLNAVAKTDTFYGLYSTRMGKDEQGGIVRSGQNGDFVYNVRPGFANKPVNFVTIYSAMRFCNWLHNGATPESDLERGAYRLLGNIPSDTVAIRRNPSARFYLPTEDEWYKAAFYDPSPAGMPTASYWSYAVKADLANAQQINFNGAYAGVTEVSLPGVGSFFGTFGQSGNVAEWTETLSSSKLERLLWGGHYSSSALAVSSAGGSSVDPLTQTASVGFRIAADLDAILTPTPTPTPTPAPTPSPTPMPTPVAAITSGAFKWGSAVGKSFSYRITANNSPSTFQATGLPAGLKVDATTGVISGRPTKAGQFSVTVSANNAGTGTASSTLALTVAKGAQTITFNPKKTQAFKKGRIFTLSATASSKLPVRFNSDKPNILSIKGNKATIRGKGPVTITASQAGNANYRAAKAVSQTIRIR